MEDGGSVQRHLLNSIFYTSTKNFFFTVSPSQRNGTVKPFNFILSFYDLNFSLRDQRT